MTFLGLPVERAAAIAELLLIAGGVALALLTGLVTHLNNRVRLMEAERTSTAVAAANATAATADERAAQAEVLGKSLEVDLERQRERAAKAETDLLRLQLQMAPRKLTVAQLASLTAAVAPFKGTGANFLLANLVDKEVVDIAQQIATAMSKGGWLTGAMVGVDSSRAVSSITIDVEPTAPPAILQAARVLSAAINAAGVVADGPNVLPNRMTGAFSPQNPVAAQILIRMGTKR